MDGGGAVRAGVSEGDSGERGEAGLGRAFYSREREKKGRQGKGHGGVRWWPAIKAVVMAATVSGETEGRRRGDSATVMEAFKAGRDGEGGERARAGGRPGEHAGREGSRLSVGERG